MTLNSMSVKGRRRFGEITAIVLQLVVGHALAAEWSTSNGDHCVTACTFHDDGNQYHWCTTAFGKDEQKSRRWDYCTPSQFTAVPETEPESESEGVRDGGNRPDYGVELTALLNQTECTTSCEKNVQREEGSYACDTDTTNPSAKIRVDENGQNQTWFYCSENKDLNREQLSARHKLWCVDKCAWNDTASGHTCNTLYGPDFCSLEKGKTFKGVDCTSPCADYDGGYECLTDEDESDYCGFHDVPQEKKSILEFTLDDKVCADYCSTKRDGSYNTCSVVTWSVTKDKANLMLDWNYCRGTDPPLNSGTIIGICIFFAGLMVPTIAILYATCCYEKKPEVRAERARNRAAGAKGNEGEVKNLTNV